MRGTNPDLLGLQYYNLQFPNLQSQPLIRRLHMGHRLADQLTQHVEVHVLQAL